MSVTIERPPTAGAPPALPPFLQKRRGGPERRVIILPCLLRIEQRTKLLDSANNWQTIVYQWMTRIVGESLWDPEAKWELTHTSTRRYRSWLETYEWKDGIPPHIQFGGAIEAGQGDPTFYDRWKAYAKEMFC